METYYINNLSDLPDLDTNSCAIGNFDGVHLGHQNLIEASKISGYKTLVITFENLNKTGYLTNTNQKIKYLEQLDIDYLVIFPFRVINLVFFNEFMKILKALKVKYITCGIDFRFGFKREGDTADLKKKFKLNIVEDYMVNSSRVSSSLIKDFIKDGYINKANNLLKNPYTIIGNVVHGNKVGRKLGFPTANIDYKNYILPKNGVYLTITKYKDKKYLSMTNIGNNPTLNAQEKIRLEVHILDFNEEIYGEEVEVTFIKYLREEKKFSSKEELTNSLLETINICREHKDMIL